jgi:NarL family two-component system response regulator LiaR
MNDTPRPNPELKEQTHFPSKDESAFSLMIVEDHNQLRSRLKDWLEIEYPRAEITAAGEGYAALEMAEILPPDILIIDYGLPGMRGDEVAIRMRDMLPDIQVIVITVMEGPSYEAAAQACQAIAYIPKRKIYSELLPVINSVLVNISN